MKRLKRVTCSLMALCLAFGGTALTACGNEEVVNDGKTVNIRLVNVGYGKDFIYELKNKFETVYKEEGYKMNVLEPSSDMRGETALKEMARGWEDTGIDMYITSDIRVNTVVTGDYGLLAADLTELVYNQKPIGYDGKEEEELVSEKISDFVENYVTARNGIKYGFNWAQSTAGVVVNTRKLAKYGITELPRTTNEMFDVFEMIYMGANGIPNSEKSTTFPVTYMAGTNGYAECAFWSWYAQQDFEAYTQFMTLERTVDGVKEYMIEDGYEVFNSDALEEVMTLAYRAMDTRIAAYGSTTQTIDQAQAKVMKDGNDAIFMFNGDWMLNEVKLNYRNYLNDIEFMNTPVNSAVGKNLFVNANYNLNEEQADELLSLICKKVDERKSIDEIISEVKTEKGITLAREDAEFAARARGMVFARGVEHPAYVMKGSPNKEIAALVLRMMASDDFAETFSEYANTATPYADLENLKANYKFVEQAFNITTNPHAYEIRNDKSEFRRQIMPQSLPNGSTIAAEVFKQTISMYDGKGGKLPNVGIEVYRNAAKAMKSEAYTKAKDKWKTWLETDGVID